jgi:hypothetical protein
MPEYGSANANHRKSQHDTRISGNGEPDYTPLITERCQPVAVKGKGDMHAYRVNLATSSLDVLEVVEPNILVSED